MRKNDGRYSVDGFPDVDARVTSQEEAEKAEFVICGSDSFFPDDVRTFCAFCAAPIVHRPHAPKRAKKVCLHCGQEILQEDDSPVLLTTEQSLKEAKAYLFRH